MTDEPESTVPDAPTPDTRTAADRQWRVEVDELRTGDYAWRLYQSDVDGQPWDLVQRGTANSEAQAIKAAEDLRDENLKGSVVRTISVDLGAGVKDKPPR